MMNQNGGLLARLLAWAGSKPALKPCCHMPHHPHALPYTPSHTRAPFHPRMPTVYRFLSYY